MIKTKIKQVTYERLESDPHGYNNTRIGMIADVEDNDVPLNVINLLRRIVTERLSAYREVQQASIEMSRLASNLSYNKDRLHQIKMDDETALKIVEIRESIADQERKITILKHKIDKILE